MVITALNFVKHRRMALSVHKNASVFHVITYMAVYQKLVQKVTKFVYFQISQSNMYTSSTYPKPSAFFFKFWPRLTLVCVPFEKKMFQCKHQHLTLYFHWKKTEFKLIHTNNISESRKNRHQSLMTYIIMLTLLVHI